MMALFLCKNVAVEREHAAEHKGRGCTGWTEQAGLLSTFDTKTDHFTQTGSGQT